MAVADEPTAQIDTGAPVSDAPPAAAPSAEPSAPRETQREIMARVFDSAQERQARANGEVKPPPQPRSPTGQFAPKAADAQPDAKPAPNADQQPAAAVEAPKGWSDEAKALWSTLSPDAQKHIAARESEFSSALETHTEKLKGYDNLGRVLEPWREVLTKGYGGVEQGISTLLGLAANADKDWNRFVVEQTRARGVSPEKLMEAFGTIPVPDPQTVALQHELSQLRHQVQTFTSAQDEALNSEAQRAIAEFKAKPENKHFDKLAPDIGKLLKTGAAESLSEAYLLAAAKNPEVSALIAKEKADADEKARAEAERERQAKARGANAANIRTGAPANGAQPRLSQRDQMAAVYDRLNGATSH